MIPIIVPINNSVSIGGNMPPIIALLFGIIILGVLVLIAGLLIYSSISEHLGNKIATIGERILLCGVCLSIIYLINFGFNFLLNLMS